MNITERHALDRRRRLRDSLARSASYRPLRLALANATRTDETHTCADGWVPYGAAPCAGCAYEDRCAQMWHTEEV